jgi:hypothetical protein
VKGRLLSLLLVLVLVAGGATFLLLRSHPAATPSGPAANPVPARPVAGGCAAVPHRCGFPDGTNSGVPAGTRLKSVPGQISRGPGWYYDPRGWVEVVGNGAVLSGLSIHHNLDISASNVIVKDDRIVNSGQGSLGISLRHTRHVTIEDTSISGVNTSAGRLMVGIKDVYGDSTGTTILRDNISCAATGIQLGEGLILENYLHNPGYQPGDHVNGITANGGRTTQLTIRHNTVFVNYTQTDAISLFQDHGIQGNRTIDNNLLAGGGYTIYGGVGKDALPFNVRITDNRFSSIYFAESGHWGPVAYYTTRGHGNVWSGNIWDKTGRPIRQP